MSFKKVQLIGICYEGKDHFFRGSMMAPSHLRWGFLSLEETSLVTETSLPPFSDLGDHYIYDLPPEEGVEKIGKVLTTYLDPHLPFLILGGDHTVTLGAGVFLKRVFSPPPTILHLDAHLDDRDIYEGNRFSHGTVARRLREMGFSVVHFGYRTWDPSENRPSGFLKKVEDSVRSFLEGEKSPLYLTLDLDLLNPGEFPAVGYPEPGGVSFSELWRIFSLLKGRLLGADLVEMSPLRDPMGVCAQLGGAVVRELLSVLGTFS